VGAAASARLTLPQPSRQPRHRQQRADAACQNACPQDFRILTIFVGLVLLSIGAGASQPDITKAGGWVVLAFALLAWYHAAGDVIAATFGRKILPVGPPRSGNPRPVPDLTLTAAGGTSAGGGKEEIRDRLDLVPQAVSASTNAARPRLAPRPP
jgi:hypothetical protein